MKNTRKFIAISLSALMLMSAVGVAPSTINQANARRRPRILRRAHRRGYHLHAHRSYLRAMRAQHRAAIRAAQRDARRAARLARKQAAQQRAQRKAQRRVARRVKRAARRAAKKQHLLVLHQKETQMKAMRAQKHAIKREARRAARRADAQLTRNYKHIRKIAFSKLHDRYVYGAEGPHVFDCSGFTMYVMAHGTGINLPHNTVAQYNVTRKQSLHNIRKGDLVFFGNGSPEHATHVGLAISHTKMIDAQNSGVVKESIHAPWWHLVGVTRP